MINRPSFDLSGGKIDFDRSHLRQDGGVGWFQMKSDRFLKVGEGEIWSFALAGDVKVEALGDEPVVFLPEACGEGCFHG